MSSAAPFRFDVFLSYNSQDRPAVEEMTGRLRAEELKPYLEVDELDAGEGVPAEARRSVADSKTCVVFLGPSGLGPWQKEEMQVAIDRRVRDARLPRHPGLAARRRAAPAGGHGAPGVPDQRVVGRIPQDVSTTRRNSAPALGDHRQEATARRSSRDTRASAHIVGWRRSARTTRSSSSAGRTWPTGSSATCGARSSAAQGVRLLAVLGPSGSGKSSVVLAGLIPRLKAGRSTAASDGPSRSCGRATTRSRTWRSPGLARSAREGTARHRPGTDADKGPRRRRGSLTLYARLALRDEPEDVRLVVVVDQFEEVFTYRPQDEQAQAQVRARPGGLLRQPPAGGGQAGWPGRGRADDAVGLPGACAPFQRLNDALNAHLEQVGPMREVELRKRSSARRTSSAARWNRP